MTNGLPLTLIFTQAITLLQLKQWSCRTKSGQHCTSLASKIIISYIFFYRLIHQSNRSHHAAKFKTLSHLKRHQITHTDTKNYKCEICRDCFSRKFTLKTHMTVHTKEKRFSCSFCDRKFAHSITLKGHERTHTLEKPFPCTGHLHVKIQGIHM